MNWTFTKCFLSVSLFALYTLKPNACWAQQQQILQLEEITSFLLSDTLTIGGAAFVGAENWLAWERDGSAILVGNPDRVRTIGGGFLRRVLAAAFVEGDSVIEVVDAGSSSIMRMDENGRVHSRTEIGSLLDSIDVETAIHSNRWYLGGRTWAGDYSVYSIAHRGGENVRLVLTIPASDTTTSAPLTGHLGGGPTGPVLSLLHWPFESVGVGPLYSLVFTPELPDSARGAVNPEEPWVSLPLVELDAGYVQTIAHLGSDKRMIVRFDNRGKTERTTLIEAPIGFIASDPGARLMLAARNLGRSELVVYAWSWAESP